MLNIDGSKLNVVVWEARGKGLPFIKNLKRIKSDYFTIAVKPGYSPPDQADHDDWSYTYESLLNKLKENESSRNALQNKNNLNIIIVDVKTEDRYYAKILTPNIVVLSYYYAADVLTFAGVPLRNLFFKTLYEIVLLRLKLGENVTHSLAEKYTIHEDIGCIFDMNAEYFSLPNSTRILRLSKASERKLSSLSEYDIIKIRKELKRFKQKPLPRIKKWIENNLYLTILFITLANIILSILGNFIYDLMVGLFE